mmetsp:Transcript_27797/g.24405  ORF Transcript_27797/g.24405 Transcript_27797/m.24405 type:complete len:222 (+) Transcript_27797:415-1080(+)
MSSLTIRDSLNAVKSWNSAGVLPLLFNMSSLQVPVLVNRLNSVVFKESVISERSTKSRLVACTVDSMRFMRIPKFLGMHTIPRKSSVKSLIWKPVTTKSHKRTKDPLVLPRFVALSLSTKMIWVNIPNTISLSSQPSTPSTATLDQMKARSSPSRVTDSLDSEPTRSCLVIPSAKFLKSLKQALNVKFKRELTILLISRAGMLVSCGTIIIRRTPSEALKI